MGLPNVYELLRQRDIKCERIDKKNSFIIQKEWLVRFASRVKECKGRYVLGPPREWQMWNVFSAGYQKCMDGPRAVDMYLKKPVEPFYVFDEEAQNCYACNAKSYPDFSGIKIDLYIFPESMNWTMVFIHEQPEIGPYYAELDKI